MRAAFTRGLAEQAIGAEYIAHYLAATVTTPAPIAGDRTGHPASRSSILEHRDRSSSPDASLPFALPAAAADPATRGGRVPVAAGARRAGAKRRTRTRPSTTLPFDADGGRS
jgi:alpha-beta hydrolase superfamily lysophospholipase